MTQNEPTIQAADRSWTLVAGALLRAAAVRVDGGIAAAQPTTAGMG